MDKILITGGAGYIGSHTVHFLLSQGISAKDIVVFDNLVYGHREFLPKDIHFIKGDLLNKTEIIDVFNKFNISSVIHFAAYTYVGESIKNPEKYFRNNILGGLNLLEAMRQFNCKYMVFSSTCATYGIPKKVPIIETEFQDPINPYGESKLSFEKILKHYDQIFGIKHIILRYFNASGAGYGIGEAHDPETHLIPLTIFTALGIRKKINIFGDNYNTPDGTCIRDYIHVIDLAEVHYKSLIYLKNNDTSNYFNIGTGNGTSVKEIITKIQQISGINFKVSIVEKRLGDPAILVADNKKVKSILSWNPKYNIDDILRSAWNWHKKYNN